MRKGVSAVIVVVLLLACGSLLCGGPARPGEDAIHDSEVGAVFSVPVEVPVAATELFSGVGDAFIENIGQLEDREVRYYTQGRGVSIGLTDVGIIVVLKGQADDGPEDISAGGVVTDISATHFAVMFDGCNPISPLGRDVVARTSNYFIGNDSSRWVRGVRSFGEVAYEGLYEGVDLVLRLKDGILKYDIELAAEADASQVVFRYDGVLGLSLDATGDIIIRTDLGDLRDGRPVVVQEGTLPREGATGRFILQKGCAVGFGLPDGYDPMRPGLIDPGIIFSTLLGSTGEDYIEFCTIDTSGNYVVVGATSSPDFPSTAGTYDPVGKVNVHKDAFIGLFNRTGWLLSSTFIAGSSEEENNDMRVGSDGTLYIVGWTESPDFPITGDARQQAISGPRDGTILRISSDISNLIYSSYFGGSGSDRLFHIDFNPEGFAVVSGFTNSSDIETTLGAFCSTYERTGKYYDSLMLCVFDNTLAQIQYCSYINGVDTEHMEGYNDNQNATLLGQAMDGQGNIYLTGCTDYPDFPVSPGAFHTGYYGGTMDGFVVKIRPEGNGAQDLVAGTFLGGSAEDGLSAILVMNDGRVAVAGHTMSQDIPLNQAIDTTIREREGFFAIFDSNLTTMDFCTYWGGDANDWCTGLLESRNHTQLHCTGMTGSMNLSVKCTKGCYDNTPPVSDRAPLVLFSINVTDYKVEYCTLVGGNSHVGLSLSGHIGLVLNDGHLIMFGGVRLSEFPTTPGVYQEHFGGNPSKWDGYLFEFDPEACGLPDAPRNLTAKAGDRSVSLEWAPHTNVGYRVLKYSIYWGTINGTWDYDETIDGTAMGSDYPGLINGVRYYFGVAAVNTMGEGPMSIVSATPQVPPPAPRSMNLTTGDGNVSISWEPPPGTGGFLSGYHILRGTTREILTHLSRTDATTHSYKDWNVTKGQRYYYAVFAFNDAGNGTRVTGEIIPSTPPSPPTDFELVPHDGWISVKWGPPVDGGGLPLSGYRLYIRDGQTNVTRFIEPDPTAIAHDDHRVVNGQRYYYRITALAGVYESEATTELSEVPFGPPEAPKDLRPIAQNLQVRLEWNASYDNGRQITAYMIYWGIAPDELVNPVEIGNLTAHTQPVGQNGIKYYFQVAAKNLAGEGKLSAEVWAIPLGVPSKVQNLSAEATDGGVIISWDLPTNTGGTSQLSYHLTRVDPDGRIVILGDVVGERTYVDTSAELGNTYTYRVCASNALNTGPIEEGEVIFIVPPSAVWDISATVGDKAIELHWAPPESDGGSNITAYFIFRRGPSGEYTELDWTLMLNYTDRDVVVGTEYSYYIKAKNDRYESTNWTVVTVRAITHPGPVVDLQGRYRNGGVDLQWLPPTMQWGAAPTGYAVLRGTSSAELFLVAEIGLDLTYRDETVEKGTTYYYKVIARSAIGDGDSDKVLEVGGPSSPPISLAWFAIVATIVIAILLAMVIVYRRRARAAPREVPAVHIVEEVLVVLRDGRLIASCGRDESRSRDADLMSGMLVAIQGIAKEGLERGGMLESIKYQDNTILMAASKKLFLAVVVYGKPSEELRAVQESTLRDIEVGYADLLSSWDGDQSLFTGVEDIIRPLVERTRDVTREDVRTAGAAPGETDITP